MIYKKFQDIELSTLGLGMMRLPLIDGDESKVDEKAAQEMIDYAMENGINYYDTAWGYHSGNSEYVTGRLLSKYPRESYYLASKFPGYDTKNLEKKEEIFEKQLQKCGTDYFDFYLCHNVDNGNVDFYLDEKYGFLDYIVKQKENGKIKHLGFSAHGSIETMKRFLDVYGDYMEFCQLQINYMDWHYQNAEEKVKFISSYNIPIWVMEPVRGGKLATAHEKKAAALKEMRSDETIPGWAFRFLQSIPEVTLTLSGMSNMEQLKANIETYKEDKPLSGEEFAKLIEIADEDAAKGGLPCTKCNYCTSYCPQELNIPKIISVYNEHIITGGGNEAPGGILGMDEDKRPGSCIGCESCEKVCPQQIKISKMMNEFSSMIGM